MRISKRSVVLGLAIGLVPLSASATEIEDVIDGLNGTVDRGLEGYRRLVRGMRDVTSTMLRHSVYRPRLEEALAHLTRLRTARRTLVQDLQAFVAAARAGQNAGYAWSAAMERAIEVSALLESCSETVGELPELSAALSPQERAELRQSFTARADLLRRLRDLDTPSTAAELAAVERLAANYQAWSDAANELRLELNRVLYSA